MNFPTILTFFRIILVAPIMILIFFNNLPAQIITITLFTVAAITDKFDGYLARKNHQTTNLGAFLDPLADKMLINLTFLALTTLNIMPLWMFGVILIRDFTVDGLRMISAKKGITIPANIYGKIKTFVQDIALPLTMLLKMEVTIVELFSQNFFNVYQIVCWVLIGIATLLTLTSGVVYLVQNKKVFSESK